MPTENASKYPAEYDTFNATEVTTTNYLTELLCNFDERIANPTKKYNIKAEHIIALRNAIYNIETSLGKTSHLGTPIPQGTFLELLGQAYRNGLKANKTSQTYKEFDAAKDNAISANTEVDPTAFSNMALKATLNYANPTTIFSKIDTLRYGDYSLAVRLRFSGNSTSNAIDIKVLSENKQSAILSITPANLTSITEYTTVYLPFSHLYNSGVGDKTIKIEIIGKNIGSGYYCFIDSIIVTPTHTGIYNQAQASNGNTTFII